MLTIKNISALLAAAMVSSPLLAVGSGSASKLQTNDSWFTPPIDPDYPRSDLLVPAVSFILPGFGQFINGEYLSGSVYAGLALGSVVYSNATARANDLARAKLFAERRAETYGLKLEEVRDQKDVAARKVMLAGLVYQGSGGFSAYQAFRLSATTRQATGQYQFLGRDETPMDILKSTVDFKYLKRSSTWIPLAIGGALAGLKLSLPPGDTSERSPFTTADAFFTTSFSGNAGTHEEAMFRGWVMPVLREYTGSDGWSNVGQGVIFALAHLSTVSVPLPQFLLGLHLGNVTQRNGWEMGEAVFIHTWWDIIAFWTQFQYNSKYAKSPVASAAPAVLWLPPLEWVF
ncbi:MAG: CPBP family intramembrane metalloprotease [Deltaproteobacteria bacterium]|nr:CPBP family intramembrane metalloprotease [Deltaproteobacteria bacterium]